jgi:hypothetical protein
MPVDFYAAWDRKYTSRIRTAIPYQASRFCRKLGTRLGNTVLGLVASDRLPLFPISDEYHLPNLIGMSHSYMVIGSTD